MKLDRIGLVANVKKKEIRRVIAEVLGLVPEGIDVVGRPEDAELIGDGRIRKTESYEGCDAVIALGGDGTLLVAARLVETFQIPVLGIKIRSLGFLTEDDPKRAVKDLLEGCFEIQERVRLEVSLESAGRTQESYSALNDVVIHGSGVSRVLRLKTTMDGTILGEYLADGVIVSTPTGSTAYSLAAGGPIINPTSVDAFIITPLCPHSLSVRPIVVSCDEVFTVELVEEGQETLLTIDGQQTCGVKGGDRLIFGRSPRVTRLIVTKGYDFYDLVRRKLKWGGVLRKR